jgi:hypothetical protein
MAKTNKPNIVMSVLRTAAILAALLMFGRMCYSLGYENGIEKVTAILQALSGRSSTSSYSDSI